MKSIKKGAKSDVDGFLLTVKEYEDYKKLLEAVEVFKVLKNEYYREFVRG